MYYFLSFIIPLITHFNFMTMILHFLCNVDRPLGPTWHSITYFLEFLARLAGPCRQLAEQLLRCLPPHTSTPPAIRPVPARHVCKHERHASNFASSALLQLFGVWPRCQAPGLRHTWRRRVRPDSTRARHCLLLDLVTPFAFPISSVVDIRFFFFVSASVCLDANSGGHDAASQQ